MCAVQKPDLQAGGYICIVGVKGTHFCNTGHVPVWYESVGNYSWGNQGSGRQHIRTDGKEKDRFIVQLSVTKAGRKLTTFLTFKGEYLLIGLFVLLEILHPVI